jgi:GTP pyrophosphokinase
MVVPSLEKMIPRLKERYNKLYGENTQEPTSTSMIKAKPNSRNSIILDQINDIAIKFAQCCNPLPGDDIVGFITRGFGLSVHTTKCTNYRAAMQRNDAEEVKRWFDIQWSENTASQFQTSFEVIADNRIGLMYDITAVLMESRIPIVHSSSRVLKNGNALFECTIVISSMEQLKAIFDKIKKIKNVISVERSTI